MEVVAQVSRRDELVAAALASLPDVAPLDIQMPGGDGISAAGEVRRLVPGCAVVTLTTFGRSGYLRRAIESGASGFLLKDAPIEDLAAAIRKVTPSAAECRRRAGRLSACRPT